MKSFLKFLFIIFLIGSGLVIVVLAFYFYENFNPKRIRKIKDAISSQLKDVESELDFTPPIRDVEETLDPIVKEVKKTKKKAQKKVAKEVKMLQKKISKRQGEILDYLEENNDIAISDIMKNFSSVSSRTLRRDLSKLEELGHVRQVGKTKDSRYKFLN